MELVFLLISLLLGAGAGGLAGFVVVKKRLDALQTGYPQQAPGQHPQQFPPPQQGFGQPPQPDYGQQPQQFPPPQQGFPQQPPQGPYQ